MKYPSLKALLIVVLTLGACHDPDPVETVSPLELDLGTIESGSVEEAGVLAFLNRDDLSFRELDSEVGLDKRAALNILAFRAGPDGVMGTGDDRLLVSIGQLDGISFVGPSALERLLRYVIAQGGLGPSQAIPREEAILGVVNHPDLSLEVLDHSVGLDRRSAESILSFRVGADGVAGTPDDQRFLTVDEIDELRFVGPSALNKLFNFALKMNRVVALSEQYAPARALLAARGFPQLSTAFSTREVKAQERLGAVTFEQALSLALTSVLTDGEDIESPLGLVGEYAFEDGADPAATLRGILNRPASWLGVVPVEAEGSGVYPPENGESIETNWVFHLAMESFSDHLYWVVVPRGGGAAYNYGFN